MTRTLIPILMMAFCFALDSFADDTPAAEPHKPPCNAQNHGKLWPEKIGEHADTPIEVCSWGFFHYRWKPVTVDISQLIKEAAERKSRSKTSTAAESGRDR